MTFKQRLPSPGFGAALGFPSGGNAGIGQSHSDGLIEQGRKTTRGRRWKEFVSIMQAVQVFADNAGVEQYRLVVAHQYGNLAKRVESEHDFVALYRARLFVDDFDAISQCGFMGEHEHLSRVGRVRLIKKLHEANSRVVERAGYAKVRPRGQPATLS